MFSGTTEYGQKEIEFFNQHWERGIDWYASHFKPSSQIQGEKTAELLHRTVCHRRMFMTNPSFKLVVLLRCPVDRAFSQWRMAHIHKGDELDAFERVVEREARDLSDVRYRERFYGCQDSGISTWREGYLLKGLYHEQLESLLRWFSADQVFIGISERIRMALALGYGEIFKFLGLAPWAGYFGHHFVGRPGPQMLPRTRALLNEVYRVPNERLFSLLGGEVPEWG
jgi:hypothetical protein